MDDAFSMNSLLRALRERDRMPTDREIDTAMWLKNPSAFWLHPEGPLSDTTPEEWLAKQKPAEPALGLGFSRPKFTHLMPGEKVFIIGDQNPINS